jgi:sugar lactone lactonase YvrE
MTSRQAASATAVNLRGTKAEKHLTAFASIETGLWIAVVRGARVERRFRDGRLGRVIPLPVSRPTMPMLGGVNGSTLFVTSQGRFLGIDELTAEPAAGDLLAIDVGFSAAACTFVAI